MNTSVALELCNLGSPGLDDLLALVGLPSKRKSAAELSGAAEEILKSISSFVDGLLLHAIAAPTRGDFIAVRKEVFGQYAGTVTSLARLIRILVPDPVIERVLGESFCELEAEFREQGAVHFGVPARDQAMFTVWTLRRTSRLIAKITASGLAQNHLKEQDQTLANSYGSYALWAQFHLDCLLVAIRHREPVQLDVLPEVIDGLRAAVNAYGYAKQGLNLRDPEEEPLLAPYQWDEEDQELLDSSMREVEVQSLDD